MEGGVLEPHPVPSMTIRYGMQICSLPPECAQLVGYNPGAAEKHTTSYKPSETIKIVLGDSSRHVSERPANSIAADPIHRCGQRSLGRRLPATSQDKQALVFHAAVQICTRSDIKHPFRSSRNSPSKGSIAMRLPCTTSHRAARAAGRIICLRVN